MDRRSAPRSRRCQTWETSVRVGPLEHAAEVERPAQPAFQEAPERRYVTVLFSDLVGSTALSARLDPEDLREVISGYQRCVAETVARFGGFVAKYMGDGALVYFGYPEAHEDDPERAVRAGLDLVAAVSGLQTAEPLEARVGIATGLVIVGDLIGSGASQEQAIVGKTPNVAARLQGLAAPNGVIIADSTRKLLGNLFEFEDLGPKDLKGISEPERAWTVLRPNPVDSHFDALHAAGVTALVGRQEELDLLLRRWSKVIAGEGQVVLLAGEPGIGKSRLTAALLDRLDTEPHTRLRYFCSPQHTDSALFPIMSQMERAAGFAHRDTAQTKLDKLDALLAQSFTPSEDRTLFADLLSLSNDGRWPKTDLTPQQARDRTLHALTMQMVAFSELRPVLMIFEDVHWIDPTSLEALGRAIDRIKSVGVLLIITFRTEFEPPWTGRPYVTALSLTRLGEREIVAMIDRVTGNKPLPENTRQDIIERTDGIPLFVEEMTKAVLEAESDGEAQRTTAAVPSPALTVPASLHASLMARLDRLGPAKEVAQVGAAIGRGFSYALVHSVVAKPDVELRSALDSLVKAGLLFRQGMAPYETYLFKHALVQDAAYGTLLRGKRQQLHARIAQRLEQHFSEVAATQPSLLAQHYARAGLNDLACKFWTIAGDLAERRAMSREAVAHYTAARALLESCSAEPKANVPRLLMKLGSALMQAEGYNSAAALVAYEDARATAATLDQFEDYANASIGMAALLFGSCRYQQVLKTGDELNTNHFGRLSQQSRVHLLIMQGIANIGVGQHRTAWEKTRAACALDDETPSTHGNPFGGADPAVVARGYATMSGIALGYVEDCLSLVGEALEIARERNHAFTIAWALLVTARIYRDAGRFTDALSIGNEAIALCERYGFIARMGTVLLQTGAAYCRIGQTERGLCETRRGLELWRTTSSRFHMSYYLSDFADCLLRAKEYDEAEGIIREAEQIVAETDERSHVGEIFRHRGALLLLNGNGAEGSAKLWEAVEWARARETKLFELRALRDLVLLDFPPHERKMAAAMLREVVASFPQTLEMPDLIEAKDAMQFSAK